MRICAIPDCVSEVPNIGMHPGKKYCSYTCACLAVKLAQKTNRDTLQSKSAKFDAIKKLVDEHQETNVVCNCTLCNSIVALTQ